MFSGCILHWTSMSHAVNLRNSSLLFSSEFPHWRKPTPNKNANFQCVRDELLTHLKWTPWTKIMYTFFYADELSFFMRKNWTSVLDGNELSELSEVNSMTKRMRIFFYQDELILVMKKVELPYLTGWTSRSVRSELHDQKCVHFLPLWIDPFYEK